MKRSLEKNEHESEGIIWPANTFTQVQDDQKGGDTGGRNGKFESDFGGKNNRN